jgi:hypothetical protein
LQGEKCRIKEIFSIHRDAPVAPLPRENHPLQAGPTGRIWRGEQTCGRHSTMDQPLPDIEHQHVTFDGGLMLECGQRLERLEKLALSLEGVQQAFAIQAGREIRVVVSPQTVTDDRARELAKELRAKIETELQYPSAIKITVIREQRFTETAT